MVHSWGNEEVAAADSPDAEADVVDEEEEAGKEEEVTETSLPPRSPLTPRPHSPEIVPSPSIAHPPLNFHSHPLRSSPQPRPHTLCFRHPEFQAMGRSQGPPCPTRTPDVVDRGMPAAEPCGTEGGAGQTTLQIHAHAFYIGLRTLVYV